MIRGISTQVPIYSSHVINLVLNGNNIHQLYPPRDGKVMHSLLLTVTNSNDCILLNAEYQ